MKKIIEVVIEEYKSPMPDAVTTDKNGLEPVILKPTNPDIKVKRNMIPGTVAQVRGFVIGCKYFLEVSENGEEFVLPKLTQEQIENWRKSTPMGQLSDGLKELKKEWGI